MQDELPTSPKSKAVQLPKLRFGLKTLLTLLAGVCVMLAMVTREKSVRQKQNRMMARGLVEAILFQRHMAINQLGARAAPTSPSLFSVNTNYTWAFFTALSDKNTASKSSDPFLAAMFDQLPPIAASLEDSEHRERYSDDGTRFYLYAPLRAKASCIHCHRYLGGLNEHSEIEQDSLLAILRIELLD